MGWFAGISVATVIGFVAAADTSSSFFVDYLRDCAVPTAPPPYITLSSRYPPRELPVWITLVATSVATLGTTGVLESPSTLNLLKLVKCLWRNG